MLNMERLRSKKGTPAFMVGLAELDFVSAAEKKVTGTREGETNHPNRRGNAAGRCPEAPPTVAAT